MNLEEPLLRYAPLLEPGATEAFLSACDRPLPRAVWVNPVRAADPEAVAATIRARCPEAQPVPWWPLAFRLPADTSPGSWIEHRLGLIHVQEEATLWPAALLDLHPDADRPERVLDLCAAPGNKTAQIAVRMRDRGLVVANEKVRGRLSQLRYNLERLGLTSVVVTRGDGNRYPLPETPFDHALVDAPCTCEGTTRKRGPRETSERFRRGVQSIQIGLLRRALRCVRPGGTVVYATCTYDPEENERVLDAIREDEATIERLTPPPGVTLGSGVAEWNGRRFRPDVVNAVRLWPHHNDTGGFFVARLRRLG
ncbi:MAG: RsmB/NOP family class I SAM-dependent RNA methyltransferase [Deltaproteobacteria bacterium]|nr:MAG: RsmB/NOP family class I SAM-dependent RNA methyltransferase [Deltaproteobacteria bacterium]